MTGLTRLLVAVHNRGMFLTSSTNFHGLHQFQIPPRSDNAGNNSYIAITDYALESSFHETLRGPDSAHQCDNDYYAKAKENKTKTLGNTFTNVSFPPFHIKNAIPTT